ncbi:MAG: DUF2510 domain-containing protein [Ilumatobacter sp.]|nr:DUF2510 domain-containing protein [Ilumatobacter sp.]
MRIEDAPAAGWYPDPEGGSRLRWWEGTDWSDRYRMRPIENFVETVEAQAAQSSGSHRWVPDDPRLGNSAIDTQAVVDQVREAARMEAERAAQMFGAQARSAAQSFQPLISEYTLKATKWFRRIAILAILFAAAWFAFQVFAQKSMFDWIGDRIDTISENLNDQNGAPAGDGWLVIERS